MSQPLPEGNLNNSHRETNPVRRKVAPRGLQEKARELVERASSAGCIIRHRLDVERMKQPLQKGVFYVIENEGNSDPGFLVFLPGQAPVFLQMRPRAPPPCTLRMRVSPTLGDGGGTVLIATLDSIQHTLRLEDVWLWKGAQIFDTEVYSKRRAYLKEFVETHWVPDVRLLGGINTTVLNPKSVEDAFSKPFFGVNTIELLPEAAGRRRMWVEIEKKVVKQVDVAPHPNNMAVTASTASTATVSTASTAKPTPAPPAKPAIPQKEIIRRVRAVPIDKMPDIYDLFDENGFPISRASVQIFSFAQQLRTEATKAGIWVTARWRQEFGGYEIFQKAANP